MPFRVVTFYTSGPRGGGYEMEVPEWSASLEQHGIRDYAAVDVGGIPEWRAATFQKARVCREAYRALPAGFDLVWIDVDARVRAPLALFEDWPDGDVGFRRRYDPNRAYIPPPGELLSGTLFFRGGSEAAGRLLDAWWSAAELAASRRGDFAKVHGDQNVLEGVLALVPSIRVGLLPDVYTWIWDLDVRDFGPKQPVIEHFQASRRRSKGRGFRGFVSMENEAREICEQPSTVLRREWESL